MRDTSRGRSLMRRLLVLGLLALAGLVPGAGAHVTSTPRWLVPAVLAEGTGLPQLGVDGLGNATAVWSKGGAIQAVFRPAGGGWSAPQDVPSADVSEGPALAVAQTGHATAVWTSGTRPNVVVHVASRPRGGSFGAPETIPQPDVFVSHLHVGVDARGGSVVVWTASDGSRPTVRAAFRPAGGTFGAPQDVAVLAPTPSRPDPTVATNARGAAVAIWVVGRPPTYTSIQAVYRPPGGKFGAVATLAEAGEPTSPTGLTTSVLSADAAIDAAGNAIAVWHYGDGSPNGSNAFVRAAYRPAASGIWRPGGTIGNGGFLFTAPRVAFDGHGDAVAAWVTAPSGPVQAATWRAVTATWQAPQSLSRPGDPAPRVYVAVAAGAGGGTAVAWTRSSGGSADVVMAAVRPPAGSFGPSHDVAPEPYVAEVALPALDAQGNATLSWRSFASSVPRWRGPGVLRAAGYDAAGPQLRALRIPARGTVGRRLRFSVAPLDVWSTVASTRWRFGDTRAASGAQVSHVFPRPGRYRVTVTSRDTLGNTTSAARVVRIVPRRAR